MPPNSLRAVVADTCFWIDAFTPNSENHRHAAALLERLRQRVILVPWPILYEVLRTKTVKNPTMVRAFDRIIREPKVMVVDDAKYRQRSLRATIEQAGQGQRNISLADMVIRSLLEDDSYHVTTLLTFNAGDFKDVCVKRRIALWPDV